MNQAAPTVVLPQKTDFLSVALANRSQRGV
jgi:hypothetical protein